MASLTGGLAQDKDMETKFFNERDKIKEMKIREMTESVLQVWKNRCSRDSAKLRLRYRFDESGNLIQVDDYRREKLWKTINYKRDSNGRFYEKYYLHYDSLGNIKFTDKWEFEFDSKNRPITERLKRDSTLLLTNVLSYDKRGNYIKQVRDNYWEWYFKYNKKGDLVESNECRLEDDSIVCFNLIKYKYQQARLISALVYANRADSVLKTIAYKYDKESNLIEIVDPIKFTRKRNGGPVEKIPEFTRFIYDKRGNCISKSLSRREAEPFRCYFYDYTYY